MQGLKFARKLSGMAYDSHEETTFENPFATLSRLTRKQICVILIFGHSFSTHAVRCTLQYLRVDIVSVLSDTFIDHGLIILSILFKMMITIKIIMIYIRIIYHKRRFSCYLCKIDVSKKLITVYKLLLDQENFHSTCTIVPTRLHPVPQSQQKLDTMILNTCSTCSSSIFSSEHYGVIINDLYIRIVIYNRVLLPIGCGLFIRSHCKRKKIRSMAKATKKN